MRRVVHRRRELFIDSGVAIALAAVAVASSLVDPAEPASGVTRPFGFVAVVLVLGMTLPLAVRRVVPRGAVAISVAAATCGAALGFPVGIGPFGAVFALASLAYITTHRTTIAFSVPAGFLLLASLVVAPGSTNPASVVGNGLFIAFAVAAGVLMRIRNEQRAALLERNRELDAAREAQVRSAVTEERMRIAREVHDAVGHALVAITLQARAGQRRLKRDPAQSGDSLQQIEELAQRALEETRTAVDTIRTDDHEPGAASRPTLEDLPRLVESMRAPDLAINLVVDPGDCHPQPEQERAAYRIVQESLSNVARHARPANARVFVTSVEHALRVEVTNDGFAAQEVRPGSGLLGMRERAERLGGSLSAGPTSDGWQVVAHLPGTGDASKVPA